MSAGLPAWADVLPPWTEPPPLKGDATADVCVIGLGGTGLRAVTALRRRGLDMIGLDAGTVAGGAAGRNGGLLLAGLASFHHDAVDVLGEEAAVDWYRATLKELDRIVAEHPAHVRRTGSLRIAADAAELNDCRRQLDLMRTAGLPAEPYAGPEGEGLLFPHDASFNPLARCRQLAEEAAAAGARLYGSTAAVDAAAGAVTTRTGTVRCRAVVVAVDGNPGALLSELAADIRPVRLQMIGTAPAAGITVPRPVYRRYGFEYWQQLEDGRLLLGGFRDAGGQAEEGAPPRPEGIVQDLLEQFLRTDLGVHARITHRWAATVGYRRELLPFSGEVRPGVFALGGYNGTGNVMGPLLARRLAEQVSAAV